MAARDSRQSTGQRGEAAAADYLARQGYTIVTTNWRCAFGELDLVAQQGDMLVFVEVRTRHADADAAFASITPKKRNRLVAAVAHYLDAHDADDVSWRIDVIAVAIGADGISIEHVEDALDW